MIRSHKLFYHKIKLLINLRNCRQRFIHNGQESPMSEKPFNSLERVKWYICDKEEYSKTATRICLTIIGNGAVGQPRCLCMFTDYRSYMFNCGEGAVRLTREHEVNLQNVRQIFLTKRTWENVSGIADVYLTHQTYGVPKLTLHGPPGIEKYDSIVASFKKMKMKIKTLEDSPYVDEIIEIEYVPIYWKNLRSRKPNVTGFQPNVVVSYICKIKDRPGDLLFQKCVDFGVPLGPQLLELKNGNDVILPSGKYIKASDVHGPRDPGFIFLVVDCQYESSIDDFVSEEKFKKYQSPCAKQDEVVAVFHFSPQHVVRSYKYQLWISRFPKTTRHFLLNTLNPSLNSKVIHKTQNTLNLLHPRIFPFLHEHPGSDISDMWEVNKNIIRGEAMLQLHLRPKIELDRTNVVKLCREEDISEAKEVPGFHENVSALQTSIAEYEKTVPRGSDLYPEIIFLGTGSSSSTAYRNVTGILINLSPNDSILLDCGAGIYSQLIRYFGYDNISSVLKKISCIFLSHHHVDHYIGVFRVLKARKEAFISSSETYRPPAVMSMNTLDNAVNSFHKFFGPIKYDIRVFYNHLLTESKVCNHLEEFLGDVRIFTVPVIHCKESYGVVLENNYWKIVYSGDAAPCQTLIDAGKNCTLLIHEASIEDGFINEATLKKHSTPSQVVDIAEQMEAQHLILTHFSKRYLAVPLLPAFKNASVGCAFDNMCVRLSDLPILPMFIPTLKCLFAETLEQHYEQAMSSVCFEKVFMKSAKA